MTQTESFRPPPYLRGTYVQTILASNKIRTWGENPMADAAKEMILDAGEGVRLQGLFSPQAQRQAKGIVILLHGWEGSVESTYILSTGRYLYRHGYAVFRLNFRDHGETHHLNEGLFYVTRLNEIFESVKQATRLGGDLPSFIAGFSMGGNFALRIARRCSKERIDHLRHVVAISPLLDPEKGTDAIDNSWLLRRYFLKKWRRSLRKKQQLFPDKYDFIDVLSLKSCREMTDVVVDKYSDYKDTTDYFRRYTITNGALKDIAVPTTIIIAKDDPAVPIEDFYHLQVNDLTNLIIHHYGGHNGFIERFPFACWYERKLVEIFEGL